MKKYFIIATITVSSMIYSITEEELLKNLQEITISVTKMLTSSAAIQNSVLNQWNTIFNTAQAFVIDNSKKDTDILNALDAINTIHNNITNIIKIAYAVSLSASDLHNQKRTLLNIQSNLDATITQLSHVKMSVYNKMQAQNILLFMGILLKNIIQETYKNIETKIYAIVNKPSQSKPLPTPVRTDRTRKPLPTIPGHITQP